MVFLYSLVQLTSAHGLTKDENGKDGHNDELMRAESPVFSTFLQIAFRDWVPSPQLTEHWEQKSTD